MEESTLTSRGIELKTILYRTYTRTLIQSSKISKITALTAKLSRKAPSASNLGYFIIFFKGQLVFEFGQTPYYHTSI